MLPSMLNHTTLPVLEKVATFTQSRHGVLAGNIANIDTPGYKTRDLSPEHFQKSLKEALEKRDSNPQTHVSAGIIKASSQDNPVDAFQQVDESTKHILYHDKSDVSLEAQVTELAKNQSLHNMAIGLLSHQFRLLEAAVTERVA